MKLFVLMGMSLLLLCSCTKARNTRGQTPTGNTIPSENADPQTPGDPSPGNTPNAPGSPPTTTPPRSTSTLGKRLLVGYWHNFDNGSGFIRLKDVSTAYDVIQVAFAESTDNSGRMSFVPYKTTAAEFKADVAAVHAQNRKVLISIGGANAIVHLDTDEKRKNFLDTMIPIIRDYGFDGIDIDLEGASLFLDAGDTDFKTPKTPAITNLISAVKDLYTTFDKKLLLTMAPETFYVQVGYGNYGAAAGAYLPVIHALRDILTFIHVQDYNSGSMMGLDDKAYNAGTADFHVSLADMLLTGFPVARNANAFFPALRPDQVLIGLPASTGAAGSGFTPVPEVQKALKYLIKGETFGGGYVLRKAGGYPEFRGLMTWSVNWDAATNFEFSKNHRAFLDSL